MSTNGIRAKTSIHFSQNEVLLYKLLISINHKQPQNHALLLNSMIVTTYPGDSASMTGCIVFKMVWTPCHSLVTLLWFILKEEFVSCSISGYWYHISPYRGLPQIEAIGMLSKNLNRGQANVGKSFVVLKPTITDAERHQQLGMPVKYW